MRGTISRLGEHPLEPDQSRQRRYAFETPGEAGAFEQTLRDQFNATRRSVDRRLGLHQRQDAGTLLQRRCWSLVSQLPG
ncbi:MAG: hypothetical protein MZV65_25715 [Chromatiales bacterium]|nr:hypothetical protein [Chromatiales bacterium]